MYLIVLAFVSYVSACSDSNNLNGDGINPECNWAGTCNRGSCTCCSFILTIPQFADRCRDFVCDPDNPTVECINFGGQTCSDVNNGYYSNFGFRLINYYLDREPDVTCNTVPKDRAETGRFLTINKSLVEEVNTAVHGLGWNGTVKDIRYCDTCAPAYPCKVGIIPGLNATTGITIGFQVDFNEYYDETCHTEAISQNWESHPECEANYDYGSSAYTYWSIISDTDNFINGFNDALRDDAGFENTYAIAFAQQPAVRSDWEWILSSAPTSFPTSSTDAPTAAPSGAPTETPTAIPTQNPTAVPSGAPTETPTATPTQTPTETPTATPTQSPTETPTATPTQSPTETPTAMQCKPYANSIADIQFIGNGTNCRAGLNMSYPGGLSCDSPYIICLPQENTPAQFGYESYHSTTHRYSVDECKQECANDQRCLGIEFVPDDDTLFGDCNLIDDIPLEITITNTDTDTNAVCMEKKDDCYPYFEADDLDATMLNCYCPNNRKGFYTKKVKRTVENTRFCGNNTDTDMRIKKAQANRMFHLCENWCLFDTENPTMEYWFWDPWKTCWREQEDLSTYCTHTIENPITIEMQFLVNRRQHFCQLNVE